MGSAWLAQRGKGSQPIPGMRCRRDRPLPLWAVSQRLCTLWESLAVQMSHVATLASGRFWSCGRALPREDLSGRVDLGRREAEEGVLLSLGDAEESEVAQVAPTEQGVTIASTSPDELAPPFWEERG